jgi:hypothetical protein
MGNPLIAGFVETQHEPNTWAWSGETTEGQASPSDCDNTAEKMSDEDALYAAYHCCFLNLWNLVSKFSSESTFIFNFNVDGAM